MNTPARQAELLPQESQRGEVIQADSNSLMAVIARAAADPNTDVDKLERLLGMSERIMGKQAEAAFNEALNRAQEEMRPVAADAANPQTHSKYASYPALDRAVRPIYARHGFALSFDTGEGAPAEHIRLVCYVSHSAGHGRTYHVDMPADGKGAKGGDVMTKTHATGAAMTYGQRYLLKLIFNMAVGEDLDGNAPRSAREQSGAVSAAITAINACPGLPDLKTWKVANADALSALPTADQDAIIRAFNDRVKRLKDGAGE